MKPTAFVDLIRNIDHWIRFGKGSLAKKELSRIVPSKIPRQHAATMALLAWRANDPLLGIRILNPLIRPTRSSPADASDEEQAEYGICLMKMGAQQESSHILESLDSEKLPRVNLYRAAGLISQWEYAKAIPLLVKYVRSENISAYQRSVGEVNLAAAYVHERQFRKASALLHRLLYNMGLRRLSLLYGNCLELAAQNCIAQQDWKRAERFLEEAKATLKDSESRDEFFVRKWAALLHLLKNPGASSEKEVERIKKEAAARNHWETIRDCDRYLCLSWKDKNLFVHLYFGTPFEGFRKKLLEDFGKDPTVPETYDWDLGFSGKSGTVLELFTGKIVGTKDTLRAGHALHRLLLILCSDFYRPFRIPTIHETLFPQDYYNPASSPLRVHQAIKLLKKWFAENKLPLNVKEHGQFYRLAAKAPCHIRVSSRTSTTTDKSSLLIARLNQEWVSGTFSLKEAAQFLEISPRSALRIVDTAIKQGKLARLGKRAHARYQFLMPARKAS